MTETPDQAALRAFLKPYTAKSDLRGALSFTCTVAVYGVALVLGVWLVEAGQWIAAGLMVVVLAFASVRLYVLQHDCGHLALFARQGLND